MPNLWNKNIEYRNSSVEAAGRAVVVLLMWWNVAKNEWVGWNLGNSGSFEKLGMFSAAFVG